MPRGRTPDLLTNSSFVVVITSVGDFVVGVMRVVSVMTFCQTDQIEDMK